MQREINTMMTNQEQLNLLFENYDKACPYNGINVCWASLSLMKIDTKYNNHCTTDDYNNCPLFLSKILRRS